SYIGDEADCESDSDAAKFSASKSSSMKVTPNPFVRDVTVRYEFGYNTNVTIDIVDIRGAIVKTYSNIQYKEGSVGRMEVNLSNALDRLLFVRVTSDKETMVKKIVSLNGK
ncbi:MAG: T9SS type A sorting domain-containing protein, partial [Flavobacteriaceae bacterium]|nr:T9SS type A sorting domain-containing protein [Flavobacteriaceae bacterium]